MGECIVVDIGKSQTRWSLHGRSYTGRGIDPAAGGSMSDALLHALTPVAESASSGALRPTVFVGSTALPETDAEVAELKRRLPVLFPGSPVFLASDAILAHAAALGGPGVVASVGTGVAVSGLSPEGDWARLDGWGPDLGDRGGAFDLGRAALRLACRHLDGLHQAPGVLAAVESHLGRRLDRAVANDFARAASRNADIAALALAVVTADDPQCRRLVTRSAESVADTCLVACRSVGVPTVSVLGRLGRAPSYLETLTAILSRSDVEVVAPRSEVLDVDAATLLRDPYRRSALRLGEASDPVSG